MIIRRIKEKFKNTIDLDKKLYRDFGLLIALIDFNKSLIFRKNILLGKMLYYEKYKFFKKIFYKKYKNIIDSDYYSNASFSNIKEDSNIYFFWWQGFNNNTPREVIQNLNSLKKNRGKHNVIILTKNNIKKYIKIPKIIYEKLENGSISITHFSDILRTYLLSSYGGIWSDASFYWKEALPRYVYKLPVFSIKHGLYSKWHPCMGQWTVGLMGCGENCPLFKFVYDIFNSYLIEYDYFCCYLLLDTIISLAYDNIPNIKEAFDRIPYNNKDVFFYYDSGSKKYKKEKYDLIMKNSMLFRNHPKMKKSFKTIFNKKTYYYYFYNEYLLKEKK